jgi:hypothetical protein
VLRRILALRSAKRSSSAVRVPSPCHRAHIRSPLPDGVYRVRVTGADLRAAGADAARAATATLTLRAGRWRLELREPGRYVERGTYAGTALRTAWIGRRLTPDDSFLSVVVARDGALRIHAAHGTDIAYIRATYGSHAWRRIGD